jgi:hypothetical protein
MYITTIFCISEKDGDQEKMENGVWNLVSLIRFMTLSNTLDTNYKLLTQTIRFW